MLASASRSARKALEIGRSSEVLGELSGFSKSLTKNFYVPLEHISYLKFRCPISVLHRDSENSVHIGNLKTFIPRCLHADLDKALGKSASLSNYFIAR